MFIITIRTRRTREYDGGLAFCLNVNLSSIVKLSDFAMIGTTFTTSLNFFNTTMSIARSECPEGLMKNSAQ